MIDKYPALIAHCIDEQDVATAVSFARENDLLLSVWGGGHNVAGHATNDDSLVIDLSPMNSVLVDLEARAVRVGGGAKLGDLDRETQKYGLVVPAGVACLEIMRASSERELAQEHALLASELADQMEDKWGRVYNLETLGRITLAQGDYDTTEQHLQTCCRLQVELGFGQGTAEVCMQPADLALRRRNTARSRRYAEEGLALYQKSKTSYVELGMMVRLAHTALLNREQESVHKQILAILEKGMEDPGDNHE
jgi:hypothetical protein